MKQTKWNNPYNVLARLTRETVDLKFESENKNYDRSQINEAYTEGIKDTLTWTEEWLLKTILKHRTCEEDHVINGSLHSCTDAILYDFQQLKNNTEEIMEDEINEPNRTNSQTNRPELAKT